MFIEDHDYHAMDNTNENVTDNSIDSVGFHSKNELAVSNTTERSLQTITSIVNTFNPGTSRVESFTSSWNITSILSDGHNESFLPKVNCTYANETFCTLAENLVQNHSYSMVPRIVLAFIAFIICLVSLAANLLILVTVTFTKRLRTANAAFLINLSMSDLLAGAIVLPMVLTGLISNNPSNMFQQTACTALGVISNVLSKVSVLTVAAIAFDRHQAIINCLEYSTMYSTSYIIKGLIWIWIQSIGFSLPPLFGWSEYTYQPRSFMCTINWVMDLPYTLLVFFLCLVMPICVMSYCYIRIIQIARIHMRRIADINTQIYRSKMISHIDPRSALAMAMVDPIQKLSLFPQLAPEISASKQTPSGQVHGGGNGSRENHMDGEGDNISSTSATNHLGPNLKREARATMRLLGLILMLAITWLPYFLTVTKDAMSDKLGKVMSSGTSVTITTWMFLVSSATNPIVYALGSRKFRNAVRRLWRKRKVNRQRTLQTQTKVNDAGQRIVSFHTNGNRVMRSKSIPTTTSKTAQPTDTDTETVANNYLTPVIILSPLEEVTTPKMSRSSAVSNVEFKFDPINRLSPHRRTFNKRPRRLPALKGNKQQGSDNSIEMTEITSSASNPTNPLPCFYQLSVDIPVCDQQ